jgi:protein deglycase
MKTAGVFLAHGFEEVEAVTVIDFLRRAGIQVEIIGVTGKSIIGSHGISVTADVEIQDTESCYDALVIPGGMPGAKNISESEIAVEMIKSVDRHGGLIAAICAAPAVVLGAQDLIQGRAVTCYPGYEDKLKNGIFKEDAVVTDGNLISSRGPGTAAEFSLAIITYLADPDAAETLRVATLQK